MISTLKKCTKCGKEKELDNFYKGRTMCKSCVCEVQTSYRENNREKIATIRKIYRENNREKIAVVKRSSERRLRYGLDDTTYQNMLLAQDNKCYMCGLPFTKKGKHKLNIDHDHSTGKVRKLLHMQCNLLLGILESHNDLLVKAIDYIKEHE